MHRVSEASSKRRWLPPGVCVAAYTVLVLFDFGSLGPGSGRFTGTGTADQVQQVWFLEWVQFALWHGHNPFFSQWANYPGGMNLLADTSFVALGILVAPITAVLGPLVTWSLMLRLAIVLSATSMCFVLRRWTKWWPAAFVGGLVYGFSSYTLFNGSDYLFLVFVAIPPLVFLLLDEALRRQRWRPMVVGGFLGGLCALQYLISSEILVSTVLMGVIASAIYLVATRNALSAKWPYLKVVAVSCATVVIVLLAYPVLFQILGPAHVNAVSSLPGHNDLLGLVAPGPEQSLAPAFFDRIWAGRFDLYFNSAPTYLGLPLLIAVVAIVVWLRRVRAVVLAGSMTAVALVLSLGPTLFVGGTNTHIPLPFAVVSHIPILGVLSPGRLALFTSLFAAAVLAMGVDEVHRRVRAANRPAWLPHERALFAFAAPVALAAIVLVPLVPAGTQAWSKTGVPSFFTSEALSAIPRGSVVLTYPYPSPPNKSFITASTASFVGAVDDMQLAQAVSRMRFKLIGGYGSRLHLPDPSSLPPFSVQALFDLAFYGDATAAQRAVLSRADEVANLRLFLRRYGVGTVIATPIGIQPSIVVRDLTAAIGSPVHTGGVTAWFDVQQRLRGSYLLGGPH